MTKEIRIDVSSKRNRTLVEKKESGPCHNPERIRIETLILNIYKIQKTIIYKELFRRLIL